ncbi:plasmid mobilization protein, partial [Alistipes shahii]
WETYHRNMTRRRVLSLHNQTVKAIHTNFNDRRAVALLSRLEKSTRELTALEQQVIDLTRELKSKWSHE